MLFRSDKARVQQTLDTDAAEVLTYLEGQVPADGFLFGAPGLADFAIAAAESLMSKGAIDVFTVGLAREVAPEGIRVCATRPGIILTTIQGEPNMDIRRKTGTLVAPVKRAGEPEEVAKSILWLASAEAAYASGAILDVAGAL